MKIEELVSKAQKGDDTAFEQLVVLFLKDIRCYCAMHFPDSHKVDEICQEVFVFAYRKLALFDEGSFKAWLKAIAFNMIRKEKQRLQRKKKNLKNLADFLIIKHSPNKENPRLGDLDTCLNQLSSQKLELLRLKYAEKLSSEQLAERFEKTGGWVRMTLCRLRSSLKKCLQNGGRLPE